MTALALFLATVCIVVGEYRFYRFSNSLKEMEDVVDSQNKMLDTQAVFIKLIVKHLGIDRVE